VKQWLVGLVLVVSTVALAQEESAEVKSPQEPATHGEGVGPRVGQFGINTSFFGSALGSVGVSGIQAPTVGVRLFLDESIALNADGGVTLIASDGNTDFGMQIAATLDFYLAKLAAGRLRPFVTGGVGFGKTVSGSSDFWGFELNGGFGAEYWFSQHFSLAGRLMVGIPFQFDPTIVRISTFTPGVRATFYF